MKFLVLTAVALGCLAGGAAARDVVRIASDGAYPPHSFVTEDGELDGFERALGDLICEVAGLRCEWVITEWDTIIPDLLAGNHDAIMAAMTITDARAQVIAFTTPYLPPDPSIYVARDGAEASVVVGVVAAQSKTVHAEYVAEGPAELVVVPTPDDLIAALRAGTADAVLADRAFLNPLVAASGGDLVVVGDEIHIGGGAGIGLRPDDTALREVLDGAIAQLRADGRLNALITRWFGAEFATFD